MNRDYQNRDYQQLRSVGRAELESALLYAQEVLYAIAVGGAPSPVRMAPSLEDTRTDAQHAFDRIRGWTGA